MVPPSCWKAPQAAGNGVVVVMLGGDEEKVVELGCFLFEIEKMEGDMYAKLEAKSSNPYDQS